ncbi:hypothetical protein JTE90_019077 [Oedothorax gibbosus]|uniref:Uncharacterized protein n=1 Tax=Oedothorax gibbosus TaxID=931172 RepID=A0AAV6TNS9_9ARAC|nr:hypothetical protein JTE90_019077 [Oedothorax gibbosus]
MARYHTVGMFSTTSIMARYYTVGIFSTTSIMAPYHIVGMFSTASIVTGCDNVWKCFQLLPKMARYLLPKWLAIILANIKARFGPLN